MWADTQGCDSNIESDKLKSALLDHTTQGYTLQNPGWWKTSPSMPPQFSEVGVPMIPVLPGGAMASKNGKKASK